MHQPTGEGARSIEGSEILMSHVLKFDKGQPSFLGVAKARSSEVKQITQVIQQRVPICLPVDKWEVARRIDRYLVLRKRGQVVATASLVPIGGRRLELRSVAVARGWEHKGLGSLIVRATIARAIAEKKNLYCVTTKPAFFESLGFRAAPVGLLPEKQVRKDHPVEGKRQVMAWIASNLKRLGRSREDELRTTA